MGKIKRKKKKPLTKQKILLTNLSAIRNKQRRTSMYIKWKDIRTKQRAQERRKRQEERRILGDDAPPMKPQRTIETAYPPQEKEEEFKPEDLIEEQEFDEFAAHFSGDLPSKILITNGINIKRPTKKSKNFIADLVTLIPNSNYYPRKNYSLASIQDAAIQRDFTGIIVVSEEHKKIHSLYHICLPEGPCARYRVSNVATRDELRKPDNPTTKYPELITKNFTTRLGKRVVRMLQTLFPAHPNLMGRQTVTFHNQRDFIFLRRHRYLFKSRDKVGIREVGPRCTLRLQDLQLGLFDPQCGEYEFKYSKNIDPKRKRHFL